MHSIRTFLLVVISVIIVLVFVISASVSFNRASYETDELFDAELAQTARILRSTLSISDVGKMQRMATVETVSTHDWEMGEAEADDEEEERTTLGHAYERKIMFQVVHAGKLILRSDNSPIKSEWALQEGYQQFESSGFRWHLFSLVEGDFTYTVGERGDIRDEVARKIALSNLYPSLLALPILLLLLVGTLQRGLRPLNDLDTHIQQRDKDNLDPITLPTMPMEIMPIVESLNGLLARLRRSMESERRFSATASHEMRTPLAVLKVNVQNALKAQNEQDRAVMLQDIDASVDRASRLINQLLTLSRLEQENPGFEAVDMDIMPVLREEIAALYPIALQRKQSIELLENAEHVTIKTVPQVFPLIVRNLVDNAIKYSPENGTIHVNVTSSGDTVELKVDDSGPGVPPEERQRIFERFYRMASATATTQGSGLGLAIVNRIAELLQAQIEVDASRELGGLSIRVKFPR